MRYTVVVVPDAEDGGFFAYVPSIPNCFTHGATQADAVDMARDAAEALLLSMAKHGEDVPVEAPGATVCAIDVSVPVVATA